MRVCLYLIFLLFLSMIACEDHGITPAATKIVGTVKFIGAWPENATLAYVVLGYSRPPNDELNPEYMANYIEIPYSKQPAYFDYELYCEPDTTYRWLIVAVLGNLDSLGTRNIVGEYKDPLNPENPGFVRLSKNEVLVLDTIVVDFTGVHIPFAPPERQQARVGAQK
jgi:hypothetical protein